MINGVFVVKILVIFLQYSTPVQKEYLLFEDNYKLLDIVVSTCTM